MEQRPVGLGLREAARKYSVDAQTIRYWIKRGWVLVLQEPDGPGRAMLLDEATVVEALKRYTPHRDRVGRPLRVPVQARAPVASAPSAAAGPAARLPWRDWRRLGVALATGALLLALLLVPTAVFGLGAAITPNKVPPAAYLVGEGVKLDGDISFNHPENAKFQMVELNVAGAQPLTNVQLPLAPGSFNQNALGTWPKYTADPDGAGPLLLNGPIGSLTGVITLDNVFLKPFGFGYGYGYSLGSGAKIKYALKWTPPVKKFPAPPSLPPSFNTPQSLFDVPGGAGAAAAAIGATLLYPIPGVPGAPAGSKPLDLVPDLPGLHILVNGAINDILITVDAFSGIVFGFDDTGVPNATAAAKDFSGNRWVAFTDAGVRKLKKLPAGSVTAVSFGATVPTADLTAMVFDSFAPPFGLLRAAEKQTDPTANIRIWNIDPATGLATGFFTVPAAPTGGGYDGLALVPTSPSSFMGALDDDAAQFDSTGSIIATFAINNLTNPGAGFTVGGLAISSGIFLANIDDTSIYTAPPPAVAGPVVSAPRALVGQGTLGDTTVFVVTDAAAGNDNIVEVTANSPPGTTGVVVDRTGYFDLDPGPGVLKGIKAPSASIESIEFIDSFLYVVDNAVSPKVLKKLNNTSAAARAATETGGGWTTVAALPTFVGDIGGMAKKGPNLVAAERFSDTLHTIDPVTGAVLFSFGLFPVGIGTFNPFGLEGLAFIPASVNPAGTDVFVGVKGNGFFRIKASDPGVGGIQNVDFINPGTPPFDMSGAHGFGGSGNILVSDEPTVKVYSTVIPGTPPVDATTAGEYSASLKVTTNPLVTESSLAAFTIKRVAALDLKITKPVPNEGFTSKTVLLQGTINDPTVIKIGIVADLNEATLVGFGSPSTFENALDRAQYTRTGLWHFTNTADAAVHDPFIPPPGIVDNNFQSGFFAYYGQNETSEIGTSKPNYCTMGPFFPVPPGGTPCDVPEFSQTPNSGFFDTPVFKVGENSTLSLKLWWENEGFPAFNWLLLQECSGTPGSGGAICKPLAQFSDPGFVFGAPPVPAPPGFAPVVPKPFDFPLAAGYIGDPITQLILVPNHRVSGTTAGNDAVFTPVKFPLPAVLVGQNRFLRFFFNTGDFIFNRFTGVLIDDLEVIGKGSQTLADATVDPSTDPPSWTLTINEAQGITDGENLVKVTADHTAYDPSVPDATASVTFFVDTVPPVVILDQDPATPAIEPLPAVTSSSLLTVKGKFVEAQPKVLSIFRTHGGVKTLVFTKTSFVGATFEAGVPLLEGSNLIEARLQDKALQCNTATPTDCTTAIPSIAKATVALDTTPPVLQTDSGSNIPTAYPIGNVSARPGDFVVFQAICTDAFGIRSVKAAPPGSASFTLSYRTNIPGAVQDQWIPGGAAVAAPFLLPFVIPAVPPGDLTLNVQCTDTAGNTANGTTKAKVVSTLEGFVINFLPGDNVISLPIIPGIANAATLEADIDTLVAGVLAPVGASNPLLVGTQAIDKILYYDATKTLLSEANRWSIWTSDPLDPADLTKLRTGRGYLFQMKAGAFKASASLAPGVPATPAPIAMRYLGTFLLPGQTVPPVYVIEGAPAAAWNLAGFHSEKAIPVELYLASLKFPERVYGSVLVFQNFINFPLVEGAAPEVILGAFKRLLDTDSITPGFGLWLFALGDGVVTP
jgi:hypothetical protein